MILGHNTSVVQFPISPPILSLVTHVPHFLPLIASSHLSSEPVWGFVGEGVKEGIILVIIAIFILWVYALLCQLTTTLCPFSFFLKSVDIFHSLFAPFSFSLALGSLIF